MPRLLPSHTYLCFLVSVLAKKNAEAIKSQGILQKYVSKNKKYIFVQKKKNVPFKKSYFCLSHDFQT